MRSLRSPAKILLTFLLLGLARWNGVSCFRVPNQRAEWAYPEPCYDWIKIHECNMGSTPQTSASVVIAECTTTPSNPWARAYRYFAYQFDLIQEDGDGAVEHGGVVAVSRCTKRTSGIVDRPDAVAVIRSPAFNPGACLPLRVTFWFRLSHPPTFSGEPEQEYNLKVFVGDHGQPFPSDRIWGKENDYAGVVPNEWHYAEAFFGRNAGEQFTVNFFAYHNDDCQTNLKTISVDNIAMEQAVSSDLCTTTTTPYTTTTVTSTVSITTTDTTTTDSTTPSSPTSDGTDVISGCEIGPAIVATCLKGVVNMPLSNFETSDAVETVFNGDNTYACRTHLRSLHVWLLAKIPVSSRTNYLFSAMTVTCRKGQLDFSHYDPDSTEATKLVFRAPSVDLRCRTIFVEFLQHLASISH